MTATATTAVPTTTPVLTRLINVARMHIANPFPTLVVPWGITAAILGLNVAIWAMIVNAAGGQQNLESDAFQYNGGISWIAVFMMVVAVQSMSLTFRFALGFSVTRRDYYLGTSVYFVGLALLYSVGLSILAQVERATDGWGVGGAFFTPWGLADASIAEVWFLYFMVLLLFFFLGAAVATMWVRWKAYGLYAFFLGLAVLLVGAGWALTAADAWADMWATFTGASLTTIAAWTAPVTLLCAVAGFAILRRATPRA